MKKLFITLALLICSVRVLALPAHSWSCAGSNAENPEEIYVFSVVYEDWTPEFGYTTQLIVLEDAVIYDINGKGSNIIDLTKIYYCPNTQKPEYPQIMIESADKSTQLGDNIKVQIAYGCGDGFGELVINGFCEKTF